VSWFHLHGHIGAVPAFAFFNFFLGWTVGALVRRLRAQVHRGR
jgi:hypothetical protein